MTEMDSDQLTPQQREAIQALPRERAAPRELEARVVAELRSRGLVQVAQGRPIGQQRPRRLLSLAIGLAACAVFFAAGFQFGARGAVPPTAASMPRFLLLLYQDAPFQTDSVPMADLVGQYRDWATALRSEGRLVSAEKLDDTGLLLDGSGNDQVLDRVPRATEGVVSGYFVIAADGYDHAVSIASGSPHLRYGGRISIREIDPT